MVWAQIVAGNGDSLGQTNYLKPGSCEAADSSLNHRDPEQPDMVTQTSAQITRSATERRCWIPIRQELRKGGAVAWTTDLRSLSQREKMSFLWTHFWPTLEFTFSVCTVFDERSSRNGSRSLLVYSMSCDGGFCLPCSLFPSIEKSFSWYPEVQTAPISSYHFLKRTVHYPQKISTKNVCLTESFTAQSIADWFSCEHFLKILQMLYRDIMFWLVYFFSYVCCSCLIAKELTHARTLKVEKKLPGSVTGRQCHHHALSPSHLLFMHLLLLIFHYCCTLAYCCTCSWFSLWLPFLT